MDYKEKIIAFLNSQELSNEQKEKLEHIFPELRESEDERTSKELLDYCKYRAEKYPNDPKYKNISAWIAWLEKQGEKMSDPRYSILDKLIEADNIYQMSVNDAMVEEAKNKAIEALSKLEISKLLGIEKQGEQKNKINSYEITFEDILALECSMKTAKITEGGNELYEMLIPLYNKIHNAYLAEKQGEKKSADKVEPKFKVGQWIVQENIGVYKVIEVCESWYEVIDDRDLHLSIGFDREYMCHLWSINDAKNGDVLISKYNKPFIYNGNHNSSHIGSYCGISIENKFIVGTEKCHWTGNRNILPATKKQRNLLFLKMEEANYEWNPEKKELKKIEPIDKYEGLTDFERILADICVGWIGEEPGWKQYIKDNADVLIKIAFEKFNSVQNTSFEQMEEFINELSKQFPDVSFAKLSRIAVRVAKWAKPTDEEMKELLRTEYEKGRADAIAEMKKSSTIDIDEMISDYANNKERGNEEFGKPVPCMVRAYRQGLNDAVGKVVLKSAWSEEDENRINHLIAYFEDIELFTAEDDIVYANWLKSLKDRIGG